MNHLAIIGSGPTAIYTAFYVIEYANAPIALTLFEAQTEAGKGMPYHPDWNDKAVLSNIASIEIPPLAETLVAWLERQSDTTLTRMEMTRAAIDERAFFPRVVLGEYFHAQLAQLVDRAAVKGITVQIKTGHYVKDVAVLDHGIRLVIEKDDGHFLHPTFSHVVMATGHSWSIEPEIRPGYFLSPWPATALRTIGNCAIGIRGTSLSAIDAMVTLATARGSFQRHEDGMLHYLPEPGTEAFHVTLMSRKGILPEADFYHPIPYLPLVHCTDKAIDVLIDSGRSDLLDAVFDLFKTELALCAPDYASKHQLHGKTLEQFCEQYFCAREKEDPFVWAAKNLQEAQRNQVSRHTVAWRYAILRMHEIIGRIVPHLNAENHQRFNRCFKKVFVDDYATVPHESIERVLALYRANKLAILRLGKEYELNTQCAEGGAIVSFNGQELHFPAFIEAIGQRTLSSREFPFPSLRHQGVIRNATAIFRLDTQSDDQEVEIGGVALDATFHPVCDRPYASQLYCLSVPFMLSQFPFAQGITSSHDMGKIVAEEICAHYADETPVPPPYPLLAAAANPAHTKAQRVRI